jgi:hypothetical protein
MTRIRLFTAIAASVTGVAMSAVAGTASAAPTKWEPIHEEGTGTSEDFCEVEGLTVQETFVLDGRFRLKARGPDTVPAYSDHYRSTQSWTNAATGQVVTNTATGSGHDKATNNGDGTLTVVSKNVGNVKFYDGDGQLIGHVAGQLYGFELLFDDAGTPSDPSDDTLLEFIPGDGKLVPAFCPIVVPALT